MEMAGSQGFEGVLSEKEYRDNRDMESLMFSDRRCGDTEEEANAGNSTRPGREPLTPMTAFLPMVITS